MVSHRYWMISARVAIVAIFAVALIPGLAALVLSIEGTSGPLHRFMATEIDRNGGSDDVWQFMSWMPSHPTPDSYEGVPQSALVPAFVLSELPSIFQAGTLFLTVVIATNGLRSLLRRRANLRPLRGAHR